MGQTNYFSHDYYARNSLRGIRKDYGLEGLGFYWCLVEILHEEGGAIAESELESIAYDLRIDFEACKAIVNKYGFFTVKDGKISSERVLRNIQKRAEISEQRKRAAGKRWGADGEAPQAAVLADEDIAPDAEKAKQFYITAIESAFDRFLEQAGLDELTQHNIHDYRELFKGVIEVVRTKDYVVIDRKNVPVYRFLQVICGHIDKSDNKLRDLDRAVADVEKRYISGKVKNKTSYLMAALYNSALLDLPN